MRSYSLELVERKNGGGGLGKAALLAVIGAGVYYGYKKLVVENKNKNFTYLLTDSTFDSEAQEGDDFTQRVLRAAKKIVK